MGSLKVIFMRLKLFTPIEDQRKKERKLGKRWFFSMGKWLPSFRIRIVGDGEMVVDFLITPRRAEKKSSLVGTKVALERWTNDKVISWGTIGSNGLKCGTLFTLVRKPHSFGQFGIRRWRLMSGGHALRRPPSQNNVFFCLPGTSESVKHKFWDCIQARRAWRWATYIMQELCGVRTGNYDCFNWKQAFFGERLPKKYGLKTKIWHLLRGITLWTIWIERNDKVFNHEQMA